MALSMTAVVPAGFSTQQPGGTTRTDHCTKGLKLACAYVTTTTGGGGADYASGFDLQSLAKNVGINRIWFVDAQTVKLGNGTTMVSPVTWIWDPLAGKLRVTNATSEANAAGLITANSIINCLIIGV